MIDPLFVMTITGAAVYVLSGAWCLLFLFGRVRAWWRWWRALRVES